jgi:hypothetical protein
MDHVKILKRAWAILWQYRVLWIFGIILAITTTSSSPGSNFNYSFNQNDFNNRQFITPPGEIGQQLEDLFKDLERMPNWQFDETIVGPIIALGIGLACVVFLLIVIGVIARNVAEAALIRLVDDYEKTGEKKTFRQGFRMGWSKTAVRLFLINLTVAIPVILAIIILSAIVLAPLLLWASGSTISGVFGTISTIGLGFLVVFIFIVLAVAISILLNFVRRASALDDLGVFDAYKRGFGLLRENLVPIFLMWLIMLGVQLGSVLIIIPIVLVSLLVSGVIGGLLFLIVSGIAGLFLSGALMWIIAGIVSVPVFILVLVIPLAFVGGLMKVYESTVWTLTFRELTALKTITEEHVESSLVEDPIIDAESDDAEQSDEEVQD